MRAETTFLRTSDLLAFWRGRWIVWCSSTLLIIHSFRRFSMCLSPCISMFCSRDITFVDHVLSFLIVFSIVFDHRQHHLKVEPRRTKDPLGRKTIMRGDKYVQ
ncbi:hypothetical protein FIBSPDRAFT_464704 [Athelia psychrophila]|uniref:Uncharacterized protein n=1 Tax=Athelia psychrophila TaxID=1759441 RepID=A0A167U602_9AGAM|nr:hypothetical protein FIBSPDRAFT_464704 [Fibularhizoctonia sp. CBS 109695]